MIVDLLGDEIFHFFVFYKYHFDNKKGVKYEKCVHVVRCGPCGLKIEIGLLGISFKPNTDDIRQSPAIKLAKDLSKTKAKIW